MYEITLTHKNAYVFANVLKLAPSSEFSILNDLRHARYAGDDVLKACGELVKMRQKLEADVEKAKKPFLKKEEEILAKINEKSTDKEKKENKIEQQKYFDKVIAILEKRFEARKKEISTLEEKLLKVKLANDKFQIASKVFNSCGHKPLQKENGQHVQFQEKELLAIQDAILSAKLLDE